MFDLLYCRPHTRRHREISRLWMVALALVLSVPSLAGAADSTHTDPTYQALRASRPDGRTIAVENLVLERDAFRFEFTAGTFHLLQPVNGKTPGAVFLGRGTVRLSPASQWERDHLAFITGKEKLEGLVDSFDQLVLLFTDGTEAELIAYAAPAAGSPDSQAVAAYETYFKQQTKDFELNFHLRLLEDLHNGAGAGEGVFYAFVDGKDLPPAVAMVDSRGIQASRLLDGGEDVAFVVIDGNKQGFWYVSDRIEELKAGRRGPPYEPLARALHYQIDTEIDGERVVAATTTILFQVDAEQVRCLGLELLPELRVSEASLRLEGADTWQEVVIIQEDKDEDAQLAVVLPETLARGATGELRLRYAGKEVLSDQGEGNFAVGARASWYPNLGIFTTPATFELTYRVPTGNQVISVGVQQSTKTEGEQEISYWRTRAPIRVAGFNYGQFKKIERRDEENGMDLAVYTNPGTPDIIREINSALTASQGDLDDRGAIAAALDPSQISMGEMGRIDTAKLADTAMADGLNAVRIASAYFGPTTHKHVAITQQVQANFGQSWPSLIFMPYISFMNSQQRATLGMTGGVTDFINAVGYHEMAHQWWGHEVGWRSYRDQWLSEGFASFTACLALELVEGELAADECWKNERDAIVAEPRGQTANYKVGPITQGWRLSTHKSQAAGQLIYPKGAYVVHMLRMMMRDQRQPNPDAAFMAMMQDFVKSYSGRSPSTEDFKEVVQRHMTPELDGARDGTIDWFFDQWVYGTAVPKLESKIDAKKAGKDEYHLTGQVTLSDVPDGFLALVPIYVELAGGQRAKIGVLPFKGPGSQPVDVTLPLPKKPKKVTVNARYELLARD